jgi:hypothetical protein
MNPTTHVLLSLLLACGPEPSSPAPVDPGPAPEVEGLPPVTRRLTASQYEHALRDLFGDDLYVPAAPEPDLRLDGLARLGASEVSISPRGVERYEAAAYAVAAQAVEEGRRAWMGCEPAGETDEACTRVALSALGRRAWRRPLTPEELDVMVEVAVHAEEVLAAEDDVSAPFYEGLQYGVALILQSPDFLMRPERGAPADDGVRRYTGVEMASRLSFFLWDSLPDEELLAAAEAGELDTEVGLEVQVDRMIADPKARRGLRAWTDDLLDLGRLEGMQKDPEAFRFLRDGLFESAREETLRVMEHVVFDRDVDVGELLTSRETFVDRTLAMLYNVRAPAREGFGPVELAAEGARVGLFGHASLLSLHAHPRSSSATLRGKFVRTTLLCGKVPSPPANVDTSIPEPSPDAPTLRDRIGAHLEVPSCRACHQLMDPIGLAFENFDGVGVFRATEAGATIDPSGELDGVSYPDLAGLAEAVRAHEDFLPCLVQQVTRAALGHDPEEEAEAMVWLLERFDADEHRLLSLWRALALSPLFRTVGADLEGAP